MKPLFSLCLTILNGNKRLVSALFLSLSLFCISSATGQKVDKCRQGFSSFSSYEEASKIAKSLDIKSMAEFRYLRQQEGSVLQQIPADPREYYKDKGWTNSYDFFGKINPANFLDHEDASQLVQSLDIKSMAEFRYLRQQEGSVLQQIPADPREYYKDKGWTNSYDFLGKINPANFLDHEDASQLVQSLDIKSMDEFRYLRQQEGSVLQQIPASPGKYYKDKGWTNSYDFFGKINPANFVDYEEASNIAQSVPIQTSTEFRDLRKQKGSVLQQIPADPREYYKNKGWTNWYDFLGTKPSSSKFADYKEASNLVQSLAIKSMAEFRYLRQQEGSVLQQIHSDPRKYYKDKGWTNSYDFFGKTNPANFVDYEEASNITQSVPIQTSTEFRKLKKQKDPRLKQVPTNPHTYYKNTGWTNWHDFLGTKPSSSKFADYKEASNIVQNLSIKKMSEFRKLKEQKDPRLIKLPEFPSTYYKGKGWINEYDFFGIKKINFVDYEEASRIVQSLFITRIRDFNKLRKKNPLLQQIPANPKRYYLNKGWISWDHFFGREKPASSFLP